MLLFINKFNISFSIACNNNKNKHFLQPIIRLKNGQNKTEEICNYTICKRNKNTKNPKKY